MVEKLNEISEVFRHRLETNNIRGYAVTLNMQELDQTLKSTAKFAEGDINTGVISFQLILNNESLHLDESALIYANIKTPDENLLYQTCDVVDREEGIVLLRLKTQSMKEVGTHQLELVIRASDEEKMISPSLYYEVYESLDSNHALPSENEIGVVTALINEVGITNATIRTQEELRVFNEETRVANEEIREKKMQDYIEVYNNQITIPDSEIDSIIRNALK